MAHTRRIFQIRRKNAILHWHAPSICVSWRLCLVSCRLVCPKWRPLADPPACFISSISPPQPRARPDPKHRTISLGISDSPASAGTSIPQNVGAVAPIPAVERGPVNAQLAQRAPGRRIRKPSTSRMISCFSAAAAGCAAESPEPPVPLGPWNHSYSPLGVDTIVFIDISSVCQDSLRSLAFVACVLFVDLRQFLVTAAVDDTAEGVQFTAQRLVRCPDTAACLRYPGNQTTLLFGLGRKREFDRFKISNLRAPSIAPAGGLRGRRFLRRPGRPGGNHAARSTAHLRQACPPRPRAARADPDFLGARLDPDYRALPGAPPEPPRCSVWPVGDQGVGGVGNVDRKRKRGPISANRRNTIAARVQWPRVDEHRPHGRWEVAEVRRGAAR